MGTRFLVYGNEEMLADLEAAQAKYFALHEALECVKSALEDVGMDGSLAHEIASKALKEKA